MNLRNRSPYLQAVLGCFICYNVMYVCMYILLAILYIIYYITIIHYHHNHNSMLKNYCEFS